MEFASFNSLIQNSMLFYNFDIIFARQLGFMRNLMPAGQMHSGLQGQQIHNLHRQAQLIISGGETATTVLSGRQRRHP